MRMSGRRTWIAVERWLWSFGKMHFRFIGR
jgi:hypothetical protein